MRKEKKMAVTRGQQAQIDPIRQEQLLQQQAPDVEGLVCVGDVKVSLTTSDDKIQLNWTKPDSVGRWDYVALFDANPQTVGATGYLTNQWQYVAGHTSPYT